MADSPSQEFDSPEEFDAHDKAPQVSLTLSGGYIERIDSLVKTLQSTSSIRDRDEARRVAVATSVSVLSKYAGQPLFVEVHGSLRPIDGVWK